MLKPPTRLVSWTIPTSLVLQTRTAQAFLWTYGDLSKVRRATEVSPVWIDCGRFVLHRRHYWNVYIWVGKWWISMNIHNWVLYIIYHISHKMRVATSCNYVFWTCLVTSHSVGPVSLTSCLRALMFFCVSQDHFHPWSSSGSDRSVGSLFENHQTQQPNPGTGDLPFVNFVNQKSSHLPGWCSVPFTHGCCKLKWPWTWWDHRGAIPSNPRQPQMSQESLESCYFQTTSGAPVFFHQKTFKELDR